MIRARKNRNPTRIGWFLVGNYYRIYFALVLLLSAYAMYGQLQWSASSVREAGPNAGFYLQPNTGWHIAIDIAIFVLTFDAIAGVIAAILYFVSVKILFKPVLWMLGLEDVSEDQLAAERRLQMLARMTPQGRLAFLIKEYISAVRAGDPLEHWAGQRNTIMASLNAAQQEKFIQGEAIAHAQGRAKRNHTLSVYNQGQNDGIAIGYVAGKSQGRMSHNL